GGRARRARAAPSRAGPRRTTSRHGRPRAVGLASCADGRRVGQDAGMTEPAWTAPDVERASAPYTADERAMLQGWPDYHRQTLRWKCAGLTHEQLATRSVEPSTMSLLGIVRHMADVERWWFRHQFRGEDTDLRFGPFANPAGDFDDLDDTPAAEVLAA